MSASSRPGCAHCDHGWVWHTTLYPDGIRVTQACNPCAYCWESHAAPLMIQRGDKIFWASRRYDKLWHRDLANLEEYAGARPGTRRKRENEPV